MSNQVTARTTPRPRGDRRDGVSMIVLGAVSALCVVLILSGAAGNEWWQVLILGVVEGITEFLPISSTGHLLLASDLIGFEHSIGGTFEIFIQLGAVLAVVGYYARDLLGKVRAAPGDVSVRRFWLALLIAFLPAALVGLTLRDVIKDVLFESPTLIAGALIVGGVILLLIERLPLQARTSAIEEVSFKQALGIGIAQVFALIPGVSRSGASMVGGLSSGLDRVTATAFSFYLAIPTLGAATLIDLLGSMDQLSQADLGRLLLGMLVSFVVAWVCIGWLLRYVARNTFFTFGVYRILAGLVVLALVATGRL